MKINLTAWIALIKSKTNIMEKNENEDLKEVSKGEEVFNPSEQLDNLINHYESLENPAENILVTIQYLRGAKKEIERPFLEIEVIEEKEEIPTFMKEDSFNLDKMNKEEIVEFCKLNNIPLTATEKEAMLDEIEVYLAPNKKTPE